jgi:hypothetical protein
MRLVAEIDTSVLDLRNASARERCEIRLARFVNRARSRWAQTEDSLATFFAVAVSAVKERSPEVHDASI